MTAEHVVGLVIAVALLAYLGVTLFFPEKY